MEIRVVCSLDQAVYLGTTPAKVAQHQLSRPVTMLTDALSKLKDETLSSLW